MSSTIEFCRAFGQALDAVISIHLVPGTIGFTNEVGSIEISADGEPVVKITSSYTGVAKTWGGIDARGSLANWLGKLYEPIVGFGPATGIIDQGKLFSCSEEGYIMHVNGIEVVIKLLIPKKELLQLFPKATVTTVLNTPHVTPEESSWMLRTVRKISAWIDS